MRQGRRMKRMERNDKHYLQKLSDMLLRLKAKYPEQEGAISIGDAP